MTTLAVFLVAVALLSLLGLIARDSLRSWERSRELEAEYAALNRRRQLRALARDLVEMDATVLVTPRDVEIPLDLLQGDLGLEEALETLDSIEALS